MFITIPKSKRLVIMTDPAGTPIGAFEPDDPDAPKQPNGDPAQTAEVQFERDFVRRVLLTDPSWGATLEKFYMAMDLREAFHKAVEGDTIELTKDQHKALLAVLQNPSRAYNTAVWVFFRDFFRAIERASEHKPESAHKAPKALPSKTTNGRETQVAPK